MTQNRSHQDQNPEEQLRFGVLDYAEKIVGGLLKAPDLIETVEPLVNTRDFASVPRLGMSYSAILRINKEPGHVDLYVVAHDLDKYESSEAPDNGWIEYLKYISKDASVGNLDKWAKELHKTEVKLRHVKSLRILQESLKSSTNGQLQEDLCNVIESGIQCGEFKRETLNKSIEDVESQSDPLDGISQSDALTLWENKGDVIVVPTGVQDLDSSIEGGWPVGQVSTVLGYSGTGKSEFVRHAARHAAMNKHAVVHVDIELGAERIIQRDLAQLSKIAPRRLRDGMLTGDEFKQLENARSSLRGDRYTKTIHPGGIPPLDELEHAISKSLKSIDGQGGSLVIIDSLQRIAAAAESDTPRMQVTNAMWWLWTVAQRLNVAVVVTSEQSRSREGGKPSPDQLLTSGAESRAIEYVSDIVIGLVQKDSSIPDAKPDTSDWSRRVSIAIAKNRHGSEGYLENDIIFRGPCWEMSFEPREVDDLEDKILEIMEDHEIHKAADLVKRLKRRKSDVLAALKRLTANGTTEKVLKGWILPEPIDK